MLIGPGLSFLYHGEYYAFECDRSIRFDDPEIKVKWPIENPLLSDKDLKVPLLKDSDIDFSLKYMVTGKDGQLGHDILDQLKSLNFDVIASARTDFDLSKADQVGALTYTIDLAKFVLDLLATEHYGIYHGVNEGYCSWYEFAKLIFKESKHNVTVNPITTDNYPTKAKRPLNSRLSKNNTIKAGIERMPNWEDALPRFLSSYDQF